jgi:hypothetical protein
MRKAVEKSINGWKCQVIGWGCGNVAVAAAAYVPKYVYRMGSGTPQNLTPRPVGAQAGVGEDGVEGVGELAAAVADQECVALGVGVHEEVAGGLGGPSAGGVGGDAEQVGTAAAVFEHDQGVYACEVDGVDVTGKTCAERRRGIRCESAANHRRSVGS